MLPFELEWGQSSMGGWWGLLGLKPRGTVLEATVGVVAGRCEGELGSFRNGNEIGGLAGSGAGSGSFRGGAGAGAGSGDAAAGSGSAGRDRRSACTLRNSL